MGGGDAGDGRWGRRLRTGAKVVLLGFFCVIALSIAGFGIAYAVVDVPDPTAQAQRQLTTLYYRDGKTVLGTIGTRRINVDLERVPKHVQNAVVAVEDKTFYTNKGFSPRGIARAASNNLFGDGVTQGASTITQQYVKNVHLTHERTYKRKAKEFIYAIKVDRRRSKQDILEGYLNTIYWGRGSYGIEAASRAYFNRSADKLTVEEGALLAGIIRSPGRYDPKRHREAAEARWNFVLDRMVAEGYLSPRERQGMKFPKLESPKDSQGLDGPRGHLVQTALDELENYGFEPEDYASGARIDTTFDPEMQKAAEKAVKENFPGEPNKNVHMGLAAVQPGTGAVLAMYGGPDGNALNDATQAKTAAGSTFKPFTLAAGLQEGHNLRDTTWEGNAPFMAPNADGTTSPIGNLGDATGSDYGKVDLIRATSSSINTAYVDLAVKIGPKRVKRTLEAVGLDDSRVRGLDAVPSITLGTASVAPVDLANAYATVAAGGKRAKWHTVAEFENTAGNLHYRAATDTKQVFSEEVARDVTYALTQVVQQPNGTGKIARRLDRPVAVKTGTHADLSAWFVGYTPQVATAVSIYRGDGKRELSLNGVGGLRKVFGGTFPGKVWTAFMDDALEDDKVLNFKGPAWLNTTAPSFDDNTGSGGRDSDSDSDSEQDGDPDSEGESEGTETVPPDAGGDDEDGDGNGQKDGNGNGDDGEPTSEPTDGSTASSEPSSPAEETRIRQEPVKRNPKPRLVPLLQ